MNVLVVAGVGVAIVILSILWWRLHPLLALLVGALFLLAATPAAIQLENQLGDQVVTIRGLASGGLIGLDSAVPSGNYVLWNGSSDSQLAELQLQRATPLEQVQADSRGELSPVNLVWYSFESKSGSVSKGTKLVPLAALQSARASRWVGLGGRLADGFARTVRKIGIPVTMAAIVGVCLLQSGAAARLVAAIMALFGPRGTAPALTMSGFILGIPVFFDNVFYLLLPLAKAVGKASPAKYLSAVMAIIVGATMAHSLVPPTPGPLFVAEQLNVSIGMMMLGGTIVGGIAATVGFSYGRLCNLWIKLDPTSSGDGEVVEVRTNTNMPLWMAALPIAIPILLLGGSEIVEYLLKLHPTNKPLVQLNAWAAVVNDPSLVFIGAAIVAILILRRMSDSTTVGKSVAKGVSDAGMIVLLTSAGGAFGASLQQLQIADAIGEQFSGLTTPWGLLFTAFFLTAIIRAAQGSATVAMLTSSSIVAPVMAAVELPFHPVYIALAVGCGSKPLPWMNDSGFWQVATMSGLSTSQTLQTFTVALTIMGITGFGVTLLGAYCLPLL